jgi:hypothetical protein
MVCSRAIHHPDLPTVTALGAALSPRPPAVGCLQHGDPVTVRGPEKIGARVGELSLGVALLCVAGKGVRLSGW